jgi:hypothetical protein
MYIFTIFYFRIIIFPYFSKHQVSTLNQKYSSSKELCDFVLFSPHPKFTLESNQAVMS